MSKCSERCFYCELSLSPNHEHDHFPVPDRYGGDSVVCACINCHDLKDRFDFDVWAPGSYIEAYNAIRAQGTHARIFLAKLIVALGDARKHLEYYENDTSKNP